MAEDLFTEHFRDIEERINLLIPENMYVTFQSDKLKAEKE